MNYLIESITKENAWVLDEDTGLVFELWFETYLQVNDLDDAYYTLESTVNYANTNDLVSDELVNLIQAEVHDWIPDYSEVQEYLVCQAEALYDSMMDR